jgi:hypothetical protein
MSPLFCPFNNIATAIEVKGELPFVYPVRPTPSGFAAEMVRNVLIAHNARVNGDDAGQFFYFNNPKGGDRPVKDSFVRIKGLSLVDNLDAKTGTQVSGNYRNAVVLNALWNTNDTNFDGLANDGQASLGYVGSQAVTGTSGKWHAEIAQSWRISGNVWRADALSGSSTKKSFTVDDLGKKLSEWNSLISHSDYGRLVKVNAVAVNKSGGGLAYTA